jgi:hypothetical protein
MSMPFAPPWGISMFAVIRTSFYVGGNVGYGWGENTNPAISTHGLDPFLTTRLPGCTSGNLFPGLKP